MPSTRKATPSERGTATRFPYWYGSPYYFAAGWSPVPVNKLKIPMDEGIGGGRRTRYLSGSDVSLYRQCFPTENVGLRLPKGVVGLDIDAYDGKAGWSTLAVLIGRLGPLPYTWESTNRTDGRSSIRLYRLPEGYEDAELHDPGNGVEIIQWFHRTVVVYPSVHESGRQYLWYHRVDVGLFVERVWVPSPEDLAELPERWARGLLSARGGAGGGRDRVPVGSSVSEALAQVSNPSEVPCPKMAGELASWSRRVRVAGRDGGAYETGLLAVHALLGDLWKGHVGAYAAVRKLGAVYMKATKGTPGRSRPLAEEFNRQVLDELSKRMSTACHDSDPCKEHV